MNGAQFITSLTVQNQDNRELAFQVPSLEVQSDSPEIVELAKSITAGIQDDLQKSRAIHDWVANNIAYDVDNYKSATVDHAPRDAVSVLHLKLAVCDGYSRLNAALHRAVGIPAKVVGGMVRFSASRQEPEMTCGSIPVHTWNEILINGQWIIEDSTWDAGSFNGLSFVKHYESVYFNPNPQDFAKDHLKCIELSP